MATSRNGVRLAVCLSSAVLVLLLGASGVAVASGHPMGPKRMAAYGRWERAGAVSGSSEPAGVRATVRMKTVDASPWGGYENAIYAASPDTIYVAYKRFKEDPASGGYNPADLVVAKSIDGGATWTRTAIDTQAIEEGDTLDNSVSIDGDHGSTVYIAYHVRSSGLFADMKLRYSKSSDGGASWTSDYIAESGVGDQNSIRVLNPSTVVVSAHGAGSAEGVHVFTTTDGAATWSDTLVDGGIGNGYYTSIAGSADGGLWLGYYNSLYPDHTDLHAGRRGRFGWATQTVAGEGDPYLTGLGTSAWVGDSGRVFLAYEDDTTTGAVKVAYRDPSDTHWTFATVQTDPGIGWNTSVHSVGSDVYASYWHQVGSNGEAVLGVSADGGATWSPLPIPDPRYVQPYLDGAAPAANRQFVSYQTMNLATGHTLLRVARIDS
jgi:hypothetical protein